MKNLSFLLLVVVIGSGCSHTINYQLTDKDRWRGAKIDKLVRVQTFADETTPQLEEVLKISSQSGEGTDDWRTNYRRGYSKKEIASGVSAQVAKHLDHSGLFQKVTFGQDAKADWELSGTVTKYSSIARVDQGAEMGQAVAGGFGLVGALIGTVATSGAKTEIHTDVELHDLTLKDVATGQTMWHDSITLHTNYVAHFEEANPTAVFNNADKGLKVVVADLVQKLGASSLINSPPSSAKP